MHLNILIILQQDEVASELKCIIEKRKRERQTILLRHWVFYRFIQRISYRNSICTCRIGNWFNFLSMLQMIKLYVFKKSAVGCINGDDKSVKPVKKTPPDNKPMKKCPERVYQYLKPGTFCAPGK